MEKLLYRVPEAAELMSISRSKLYELMAGGEVESVSVGRSRLIPRDALEAFVDRRRQREGSPA